MTMRYINLLPGIYLLAYLLRLLIIILFYYWFVRDVFSWQQFKLA